MTAVIRWEEPPATLRGQGRRGIRTTAADHWAAVAETLRDRPGEWAVIFEGDNGPASGIATKVKRAYSPAFSPAESFDALIRKVDGQTLVYARYVGGEAS